MGSAYKNKGVQPLLDAVVRYLPSPLERQIKAKAYNNPNEEFPLEPDPSKPFVGMAFKIVEDPYGQLTFMRIYQGTINKGEMYFNQRTGQKQRFSRIVKMHADKRRKSTRPMPATSWPSWASMPPAATPMPRSRNTARWKACSSPSRSSRWRSTRSTATGPTGWARPWPDSCSEDPTFRVTTDEETSETVIAGMGELHLEIYVERIRREYKVEVEVGAPKVSYREAPTEKAEYNYKHKKQTGGSGQYAHIVGYFEPLPEGRGRDVRVRETRSCGGRIPREYIPSVEKGFRAFGAQGPDGRVPDRRREGHSGRRLVSRRRQLGHGLPNLRPQLLPRDVPARPSRCCSSRS